MAKDPDISTHLHQPQVLGIDLGGGAIKLGRFSRWYLLAVIDCGNSSTGDTSSCCGRNGGRDRPTRSYPTKHCYWVGTPGPADASGRSPELRLTSLTGTMSLADWLEAKTGLPTVLANDANCAGLAEAWLGAGRQFRN